MGGFSVIITFDNKEMRDEAIKNTDVIKLFQLTKAWNIREPAAILPRVVWINCKGFSLQAWILLSFKLVGETWGKFLCLDMETFRMVEC
ncbi:hypothetical protein RHMOL_Rhmol04G0207800 [Rhododendron molle]|uniref:Uncharacterized protein n=1 Tax=Rhododendron molle TaxID=49168 RepID=A0ACC0P2Y4_RHOML|nr:hypothetical protein RHMOL_Rhmol04G0207800 [Rhododendron molle]